MEAGKGAGCETNGVGAAPKKPGKILSCTVLFHIFFVLSDVLLVVVVALFFYIYRGPHGNDIVSLVLKS